MSHVENQTDAELAEQARLAWPDVQLPWPRFRAFLEERFPGPGQLHERLGRLHVADLYLAFACAQGDPGALASFERAFLPELERALRRLRLTPAEREDVEQALRERLLVAGDILKFAGLGPLRSWLRAATVRAGLNVLTRDRMPSSDDDVVSAMTAGSDLEVELLRGQFGDAFRAAFAAALSTLSARDRTLLAQIYVDGLSASDVANLHGVNRSTVGRWLAQIYEGVLARTQAALHEQLGTTPSEAASLFRVLSSQLEMSVQRVLRTG